MVCIRCWSDPYCHNLQSSLGVVCVRRNNSIKNVSNRVNTERVRCITSNSCHNRRWWRIKVTSQCRRESSFIKISIRSITIQAVETNLRRVVLRLRLVRHYALRQTFLIMKIPARRIPSYLVREPLIQCVYMWPRWRSERTLDRF